MKQTTSLTALGLARSDDGIWRGACVVSDGDSIFSVEDVAPADFASEQCDLIGLDGARPDALPFQPRTRVVHEFRDADRQMGGQGDPVEATYLHALARYLGHSQPIVFLKAGQTCQVIWVDPSDSDLNQSQTLMAFDTGPGPMMAVGAEKATGQVVEGALELLLDDPFFRKLPPKWVGAENFAHLLPLVAELPSEDARATLLGMSAASVMLAMEHLPKPPAQVVVLDQADPVFLAMLGASMDVPIADADQLGVPMGSLAAQAAAFLAIRVAKGLPTTFPHTTGVAAAVGGGNITDFS